MNDNFRKHLSENSVLNNADILFYWCQVGHNEDDEASCKCLEKSRKMDHNPRVLLCW